MKINLWFLPEDTISISLPLGKSVYGKGVNLKPFRWRFLIDEKLSLAISSSSSNDYYPINDNFIMFEL